MKIAEAVRLGTTAFEKTVKDPETYTGRLLKKVGGSHSTNHKLGGESGRTTWRAGAFKGLPLYALTLVERETCPSTCQSWTNCYGSNMPFAARIKPQGKEQVFFQRLEKELDVIGKRHPEGASLRLHVLGDFYSQKYIYFWWKQLQARDWLRIYGYTHVQGELKAAIDAVWLAFPNRFVIFQSDDVDTIRPVALREGIHEEVKVVTCPEQQGKVDGCLDCGYCGNSWVVGVRFKLH